MKEKPRNFVFEIEESRWNDLWCQEVLGIHPYLQEDGGGPEAQHADQGLEIGDSQTIVTLESCFSQLGLLIILF